MSVLIKTEVIFNPDAGPAKNNVLTTLALIESAIRELIIRENRIQLRLDMESGKPIDFKKNVAAARYDVMLHNADAGYFSVFFNNKDTPRTLSVFFDLKDNGYIKERNLESVRLDLGADDFSAEFMPKMASYMVLNSDMFTGYALLDERVSDSFTDSTPVIYKKDILKNQSGPSNRLRGG